jgi:predicted transcriptional regulator
MSKTTSLSFRVPKDKADKLEELADAMDRPRSWLLRQALDAYLDVQAWQVAHIEEGRRELREGKGIPHEKVVAWLETWGTDDETDPPR